MIQRWVNVSDVDQMLVQHLPNNCVSRVVTIQSLFKTYDLN